MMDEAEAKTSFPWCALDWCGEKAGNQESQDAPVLTSLDQS